MEPPIAKPLGKPRMVRCPWCLNPNLTKTIGGTIGCLVCGAVEMYPGVMTSHGVSLGLTTEAERACGWWLPLASRRERTNKFYMREKQQEPPKVSANWIEMDSDEWPDD